MHLADRMPRACVATFLLVVVAAAAAVQAAGPTKLVVTDPKRRTLQVVSAGTTSGKLQGGLLKLPGTLGNVLYSAAAGDFAFTAGFSGENTAKAKSSLTITNIAGSSPKISKTVVIPGFSSGTYKGCILIAGDMAAKKVGTSYQVYVVAGCKKPFASVGPANYIFMYIYSPSTGKLSGPSQSRSYRVNAYNDKYGYVSEVNAMAVLGSGSGTAYIVLTTTSAANGVVYKPALHVMKNKQAVPLGILATAPALPNGVESTPRFAIDSANSFYSVYRQRCRAPNNGANHCEKYPINGSEVVTFTKQFVGTKMVGSKSQTYSQSPTAMSYSPTTNVLYKLKASPALYKKGTSQGIYLTGRAGNAKTSAGFSTAAKLRYSAPSADNVFLTVDAV